MPMAAGAVSDQAGHLGLMHGEDHGGGGAGAAERVADLGDVVDGGTEAAELDRDLHAEKFLGAGRVDRGLRKPRPEVDLFGLRGGGGCDRRGALLEQRAAVEQQTCGCVAGGGVTKRGFADVHETRPPEFLGLENLCATPMPRRSLKRYPSEVQG